MPLERWTPPGPSPAEINIEGIEVYAPHRREPALAGGTLVLGLVALILLALAFRPVSPPSVPHPGDLTPETCLTSHACDLFRPEALAALPSSDQLYAWRFTCGVLRIRGVPLPTGCLPDDAEWHELPLVPPHIRMARASPAQHRRLAAAEALDARIALEATKRGLWDRALDEAREGWAAHDASVALQQRQRRFLLPLALVTTALCGLCGAAWASVGRGVRLSIGAHRILVGRREIGVHQLTSVSWFPDRVVAHLDDGRVICSPPVRLSVHARVVLTDATQRVLGAQRGAPPIDEESRQAVVALADGPNRRM